MKIYLASSWRNTAQPGLLHVLRSCGHEVYDFRHPPGRKGFAWSDVDLDWGSWTVAQYRAALEHPVAVAGHMSDVQAIRDCDACVLLLPSGRSAAWELGFAMGLGKTAFVVALEPFEPELMFRGATVLSSISEVFDAFEGPVKS